MITTQMIEIKAIFVLLIMFVIQASYISFTIINGDLQLDETILIAYSFVFEIVNLFLLRKTLIEAKINFFIK
jgi:hypothetical protein